MPVYNGQEFLRAAIDSLLGQTFADFELILSDNASTDATEAICREYAAHDNRIRYFRHAENIGASDNYNAVVFPARGRYFKWASSNDIFQPPFLERCVAVLDAYSDAVLAFPRTRLIDPNGRVTEDYQDYMAISDARPSARYRACLERMRLNNVMNGLIRIDSLRRTTLVKKYFSSDCNMMAEVALYGKFVEVPEYLYYRRMDPRTSTALRSGTELLAFYDPKRKNPMMFQQWKMNFARFGAVWRASLPLDERVRLAAYIGRCVVWNRHRLADDVGAAIKYLLTA
ncbi:MAG TPA: glycosyltransferase family A protein [Burkholderiales bacterium]